MRNKVISIRDVEYGEKRVLVKCATKKCNIILPERNEYFYKDKLVYCEECKRSNDKKIGIVNLNKNKNKHVSTRISIQGREIYKLECYTKGCYETFEISKSILKEIHYHNMHCMHKCKEYRKRQANSVKNILKNPETKKKYIQSLKEKSEYSNEAFEIFNKHSNKNGLYFLYNGKYKIVYIGKSVHENLIGRIKDSSNKKKIFYFKYLIIDNKSDINCLEPYFITFLKPVFNKECLTGDIPTINIKEYQNIIDNNGPEMDYIKLI